LVRQGITCRPTGQIDWHRIVLCGAVTIFHGNLWLTMVMTMVIMGNKNERRYPDRPPLFHENKKHEEVDLDTPVK
jgi:hypothetical protein